MNSIPSRCSAMTSTYRKQGYSSQATSTKTQQKKRHSRDRQVKQYKIANQRTKETVKSNRKATKRWPVRIISAFARKRQENSMLMRMQQMQVKLKQSLKKCENAKRKNQYGGRPIPPMAAGRLEEIPPVLLVPLGLSASREDKKSFNWRWLSPWSCSVYPPST